MSGSAPIGAGLALLLALLGQSGVATAEGLAGPVADRPVRSEIRHWDSVIERLTRPATDGPLTDAQNPSYLRMETDALDPETPRIKPLQPPKGRLSTQKKGIGGPLP